MGPNVASTVMNNEKLVHISSLHRRIEDKTQEQVSVAKKTTANCDKSFVY